LLEEVDPNFDVRETHAFHTSLGVRHPTVLLTRDWVYVWYLETQQHCGPVNTLYPHEVPGIRVARARVADIDRDVLPENPFKVLVRGIGFVDMAAPASSMPAPGTNQATWQGLHDADWSASLYSRGPRGTTLYPDHPGSDSRFGLRKDLVTNAVAEIYAGGAPTGWYIQAIDANNLYFAYSPDLVHWTEPLLVNTLLALNSSYTDSAQRDAFPYGYPAFARIDGTTGDIIDVEGFWLFGGNFGYDTVAYEHKVQGNTRAFLTLNWTAPTTVPPAA
jgi:hypothetical protein